MMTYIKRSLSLVLFVVLLLICGCQGTNPPSAAEMDGGGFAGEGHGGDPSPISIIDRARVLAPAVLRELPRKAIRNVTDPWVREQLLSPLREAWAKDIELSPHDWPTSEADELNRLEKRPTHLKRRTAITDAKPKAALQFSLYRARETIKSVDDGVDLLLHESAHHLWGGDEAVVHRAVSWVMKLWRGIRWVNDDALRLALCKGLAEYYWVPSTGKKAFHHLCRTHLFFNILSHSKPNRYNFVTRVSASFSFGKMAFHSPSPIFLVGRAQLRIKVRTTRTGEIDTSWELFETQIWNKKRHQEEEEYLSLLENRVLGTPVSFGRLKWYDYKTAEARFPRQLLLFEARNPYLNYTTLEVPSKVRDEVLMYRTRMGRYLPVAYRVDSELQNLAMGTRKTETQVHFVPTEKGRVFFPAAKFSPLERTRKIIEVEKWEPHYPTDNRWPAGLRGLADLRYPPQPYEDSPSLTKLLEKKSMRWPFLRLRLTPVLEPLNEVSFRKEVDRFESLVEKQRFSAEEKNLLQKGLRNIHAEFYLRRARLVRGEGLLDFLLFSGETQYLLRYGLSANELKFLVLRAYGTAIEKDLRYGGEFRAKTFQETLHHLGWSFESFGISNEELSAVEEQEEGWLRRFVFYDSVQERLWNWVRSNDGREGEYSLFEVASVIGNLEKKVGLSLKDIGLSRASLEDCYEVFQSRTVFSLFPELVMWAQGRVLAWRFNPHNSRLYSRFQTSLQASKRPPAYFLLLEKDFSFVELNK